MPTPVNNKDVFGFIRPAIDAHTLGIFFIAKLLKQCGYHVCIADTTITIAVSEISRHQNISLLKRWIITNKITRLGFSYRLHPADAQLHFGKLIYMLKTNKVLKQHGGLVESIYFAGLPEACLKISLEYDKQFPVFQGDELPMETLKKLGIPENKIPNEISKRSEYDTMRLEFGKSIIEREEYRHLQPIKRTGYSGFGTKNDSVISRIQYMRQKKQLPLWRVHAGQYDPDYASALREFQCWIQSLAQTGWLDILSIGSSQLSQSDFGNDWSGKPNGGGVPINSKFDLYNIWEASRPMLVRTYAGTRNIPQLAKIYEETINIAWHALSFWWFCEIDGRGQNTVRYNLEQHIETLKIIAKTGKPFEPNVPHHFAFRGADDFTYILTGFLAAKTAKLHGIKYLIIQNMLNTPKQTSGVQDLAKSRALLMLVKKLENSNFRVFLQPRAGLDYFSPEPDKAKIQLAAVTALMDDIEPFNSYSPDIIHVVSYSEAMHLATPEIITESIKITFQALTAYRRLKQNKKINIQLFHYEADERAKDAYQQVKKLIYFIENHFKNPYSPEGLYQILKTGILPVPYLWERREKFKNAVQWNTGLYNGGIHVVDDIGKTITPENRIQKIFEDNKDFFNKNIFC